MQKLLFSVLIGCICVCPAWAQGEAIEYTLSFPAPQHRWMQVQVRFPNVPAGPLQVRMARTSPGRYALHEFDLSLRDRSNTVTGDAFLNALWGQFGRPGQKVSGKVGTPYSIDGLKETLAKVSGDRVFANGFFTRFIEGREVVHYARLLARAGLVLRPRAPGRAFAGPVALQLGGSTLRVNDVVAWDSPLYRAGVAQDDHLISLGGVPLTSTAAWQDALSKHQPGARVPIRFVRRSGEMVTATIELIEDPRMEVVLVEKSGGTLTDEQQRFRNEWLRSRQGQ